MDVLIGNSVLISALIIPAVRMLMKRRVKQRKDEAMFLSALNKLPQSD